MTFKDLKKRVSLDTRTIQQQSTMFEICKDKPFWIWDIEKHKLEDIKTKGNCCFNHIIGLPTKNQIERPIYDYQKILYDSSLISETSNLLNHNFKHKHQWVKKATGLGVTEFFLRFMAWLCLRDDTYRNSQMRIVTGPNIDIAIKLIKRMKMLFEPMIGHCTIIFCRCLIVCMNQQCRRQLRNQVPTMAYTMNQIPSSIIVPC